MIISGIFTDLFNTKFGGRHGYFKQRYYQGLVYLGGNTQRKIVYVKPDDIEKVKEILTHKLTDEQYERYTLIPFDLSDQTYSDRILELREKLGYLKDRCLHVQYGKFQWMLNHIDEDEYTWWIDAGLVCDHLFPSKYVSKLEDAKNVFSDDFFTNLKNRVNDKIYFICGDRNNFYAHGKPDRQYFDSNFQERYHPIAGFFGGYKDTLKKFLNDSNNKIEILLNDDRLYSEEKVMEIVMSENIEQSLFDDFTTWRHEESPDYKKGDDNFRNKFDSQHKPFYCNFFEQERNRNSKIDR